MHRFMHASVHRSVMFVHLIERAEMARDASRQASACFPARCTDARSPLILRILPFSEELSARQYTRLVRYSHEGFHGTRRLSMRTTGRITGSQAPGAIGGPLRACTVFQFADLRAARRVGRHVREGVVACCAAS